MKNPISFLRKSSFAIAMIFFIYFTGATQVAKGQDVSAEIQKSLRLLDIDQSNKAIESINKVIKAYPTDASIWYYLGYIQIKKGELDNAVASFSKGIQLNDKEQLNYVGKGHVSLIKNNVPEAKAIFEKALASTKSKNATVLNAIADAYLSGKQYTNEALALLLKSKSVDSKNALTFILLGEAYLQQNNGGQSVSNYEAAASLAPTNAKPHYKIGMVYGRSHNTQASIDAFKKAVSLDPEYTLAYKELGEIYYGSKDGEKAVAAQETYLSLTENPEPGKLQLAFYVFMTKNYAKANALFEQLIQLPNATPTTFRFYALSLMEIDSVEKSRSVFEQYFAKAKKEDIQANDYAYYGKALLTLKEDSMAIMAFQNSLALDSTQTEIWQLQGETLYAKKRYPEAIESFKRLMALRAKPMSQDLYAIGRAYYYSNRLVEADSAFSNIIKLQPTMAVGYLWESRIQASKDPESTQGLAKPYFEKLIEIASLNPEKNKKDLIEAYSYMGYYYYLKKDIVKSRSFWEKVLVLNPADARAKEALEILKKMK